MEYVGINSIKRAYRDRLQENGQYERASKLHSKDFTEPIFDGLTVHPEAEPNLESLNGALQDISVDLIALNAQFASAADLYNTLMEEINTDLANVSEIIEREKERIQDLNIIAGNMSYFSVIKSFTASDLSGTCSIWDQNTFMCHSTDRTNVTLSIDDVSGNGYEGNAYVYRNDVAEKDIVDSSVRTKMIDELSFSYYEYSKLIIPKDSIVYPADASFDNQPATCTISISSNTSFNSLRLQSDIIETTVEQIQISDDGLVYEDTMVTPIQILNPAKKYEDDSYIYGSGLLCFPATNYAKIRLSSYGSFNEQLVFKKSEGDQGLITELTDAKRFLIRVNDIIAFTSTYDTESYLETSELITTPVDSIAIFASEYYPPSFPANSTVYGIPDYLQYIMTINGKDYTMVPINSHKQGYKVIRFSNYSLTETYSVHIAEPIRSAKLKIKFTTPDPSYSPFLSNLKVCLGKGVLS